MDCDNIEELVDELMSDPRLVELCELQRTGDEVLDVISLTENQHSDILAWMLDAKEGHGQGDEILRDLLVSASTAVARGNSALDGRSTTSRFFAAWTPTRIRTTSFGAAFTARELGLQAGERVDLFVIDPQNKFILLIENKAGASHSTKQLNLYRDNFKRIAEENSRLRGYDHVFIALDRWFDDEDLKAKPCASSWLHLGYDWLETSAMRALMHVERGNAAARLVVSYCQRQTEWESEEHAKCLALAADLHHSHPEAVKRLIKLSRGRLEKEWLTQKIEEFCLTFLLQNKGTVSLLRATQGMAAVKSAILEKIDYVSADDIRHKRAWLEICPSGWQDFESEYWWPVFFRVKYSDPSQSKYSLALCWSFRDARNDEEAEALRGWLSMVEPKFEKHGNSMWRRVILETSMTLSELLGKISEINSKLAAVLLRRAD